MRFRLLGALEVHDGAQWIAIGASKVRSVLALLLVRTPAVVSTDRLIFELWGDEPPRTAITQIHGYVMRLRRTLGDTEGRLLVTSAPGYRLVVGDREVDGAVFGRLAEEGRAALAAGEAERAAALLSEGLALWRGPALADVPGTAAVQAEAARLEEQRLAVLETRIEADLALGRHAGLVAELRALTREHPLRERLWSQLMLALYRTGRQADALEAYQQVDRLLRDELGIEPGAELRRRHQQVLSGDPALDPADRQAPPAQLPADSTAFTGRAAELTGLLATGTADTVVISAIDGMAGIGKTALAVHVAHRLAARFPDGQLFLDLHGFTENVGQVEPADALDRLLRALGVPGHQIPHDVDDRSALLRTELSGRRMLIVLDNAATEAQVRPLLPGTPGCLVLVTSRRRLSGLDNAHPVSLDVLPTADAAGLFTRLTGHTDHVEEIVGLCGGLPLAIRIAAARLLARPSWRPGHLVNRLRDERQRLGQLVAGERGVAAAFRLSYRQLTAAEQRVFGLLGLHPGPDFDVHSAAALAGTGLDDTDQLLEALVDAHLLGEPRPGRYQFHDLLRSYAALVADETGEADAALGRLCDWYLHTAWLAADVIDATRPRPPEPPPAPSTPSPPLNDHEQAMAWLEAEHVGLLASIGSAPGRDRHAYCWQLAHTVSRFFLIRGATPDWAGTLELALTAARTAENRWAEAELQHTIGIFHQRAGRYPQALEHYRQALPIRRESRDEDGESATLGNLGAVLNRLGHDQEAVDHLERAIMLARRLGNRHGEGVCLGLLGGVHERLGRYQRALELYQKELALIDDADDAATTLLNLGHVLDKLGRYEESLDHHRRAIVSLRRLGDIDGEAQATNNLANTHRRLGHHAAALEHHQRALALVHQLTESALTSEIHNDLATTHHAVGDVESALRHHRQALDCAVADGVRYEQARAHHGIARALDEAEHWQRALEIYTELRAPEADEIRSGAGGLPLAAEQPGTRRGPRQTHLQ